MNAPNAPSWIVDAARDDALSTMPPMAPKDRLQVSAWLRLGVSRHVPTEDELSAYERARAWFKRYGPYAMT